MADNTNQSSDRDATGQFTGGAASRDAGRKGGQASSGSFQQGSDRAQEAGRKGGEASSGGSLRVSLRIILTSPPPAYPP